MPRPRARRRRAVLLGALAAGLLVACTPDDDDPTPVTNADGEPVPTTAAPTTATTELPTTTTIPLPTTLPGTPAPPELATVADVVDAVLLDETELLRIYPEQPFEPFDYEPVVAPNLCGDEIDATYPPEVISGTQLSSEELRLDIVEEIRVFRDAPHAQVAADAVVASLRSCGGLPEDVTLRGPSFVTSTTTRPRATTSTSAGELPEPSDPDLAVAQQAVEIIRDALVE
jgi:hypothetical protein